jgi:hypothetical protein
VDIINKPDEWQPEDFIPAREILKQRGIHLTEKEIEERISSRNSDLTKPQSIPFYWLVIGTFSSLFGGILGIMLGWSYLTDKSIAPDGSKYYTYDTRTRKASMFMLVTGVGHDGY